MTFACNSWSNTQATFTSSFLAIFIAWFRISLAVDRLVGGYINCRQITILCCFSFISCSIRIFLVLNISLSQKRPHMIFFDSPFLPGCCCWPVLSMLPSFSILESSGFWLFSVAEQTCLCHTSSKV